MEVNDSLVTLITQELLKRLQKGELEKGEKPPLVLIGGSGALSPGALASLESRYAILRCDTRDVDYPDNASVLVTAMSIQALTRLSEGDDGCTPEGCGLLWAILRGKNPVVLEEGIAWRKLSAVMPRTLAEKYRSHEQVLAGYGVKIVKDADIAAALSGKGSPPPLPALASPPAGAEVKHPGKRVISEKELIQACPESKGNGQTFAVGPKDILTPLAIDYVKRMHINICRSS
ncbi:MAG: hypothetical protein LBQ38_01565 [Spirochaetaceae bacterium]|jgi:ethanolamine utilization protein|nr:hypothetical protein [Spirochaetaceae bacterium]